jgi:hypothetical protein
LKPVKAVHFSHFLGQPAIFVDFSIYNQTRDPSFDFPFWVGDFWYHIDTLQIRGRCHACGVPEKLEYIALECDATGQKLIWNLTDQLWSKKYEHLPVINWGLILGCNLVKFKTDKGVVLPEKGRLFAISSFCCMASNSANSALGSTCYKVP